MAKDNTIIINNFQKETAPSSYLGFEEIRGLDTKNRPGAVRPDFALVKESGTTITGIIKGTTTDDSGNLYGFDDDGVVYKRTVAGSWSKLSGYGSTGINGIVFWRDYLILIHLPGYLDASSDGGSTWTNNFDQISNNSNSTTPTIVSANDSKLYFGSEYVIDSLDVGSSGSFDPTGVSGTNWTIVREALALPSNYEIRSLAELGENLIMGTRNNSNTTEATIFPWDRTSESFYTPVKIKENGITYMIEVENVLYVQAGKRGRWYVTNGQTVQFLAEIPKTLFDITEIELDNSYNNAVAYLDGLIYFGVSYNFGGGNANYKLGVYSLNIRTGRINFSHIISTGEYGVNDKLMISAITQVRKTVSGLYRDAIVVCWIDGNGASPTIYGADSFTNTRYTGDKSFLVSEFYRVGTNRNKRTFSNIEIELTKPQASGDSVKMYYRTAKNGSWLSVFNRAVEGAAGDIESWDTDGEQSKAIDFGVSDVENIQFKIVLNNEAELLEARIK